MALARSPTPARTTALAYAGVVFAAALFSTGGTAIKASALTGLQVAGLRGGIAALTLALLVPSALVGLSWRLVGVAVTYAITTVLYAASNKLTTAAAAIFLQSTSPLYLLVLSPWLLKERTRARDVAWLALLAVGLVAVIAGSPGADRQSPNPALGNLMAGITGLSWAFTLIGLRWLERHPREGEVPGRSGAAAILLGNTLAFLFCLPALLPWPDLGGSEWLRVSYLGVVQIGLAYFVLTRAMSRVAALDASLLLLLEPVLAPVWALIFLAERPGPWVVVGGLSILTATLGRTLTTRQEASP